MTAAEHDAEEQLAERLIELPRRSHYTPPVQRQMVTGYEAGSAMLRQTSRAVMREVQDEELQGALMNLVGLEPTKLFEVVDLRHNYPILLAQESASFCERNCMPKDCRPYRFDVFARTSESDLLPMLFVNRPCSCKCLIRPMMRVLNSDTKRAVGRIEHLHSCMDIHFRINNAEGRIVFEVRSSKCHIGNIVGKLPCGPCHAIEFYIYDSRGRQLGIVTNEWMGFWKELVGDADNYTINFDKIRDPDERALLLATVLFIDMRYFSAGCCSWTLRDCMMRRYGPLAAAAKVAKYAPVAMQAGKYGLELHQESRRRE